jgi:hypothetical protein
LCVRVCVSSHARMCVCACVYVFVRARACVRARLQAGVSPAKMLHAAAAPRRTHARSCMRTCAHTCPNAQPRERRRARRCSLWVRACESRSSTARSSTTAASARRGPAAPAPHIGPGTAASGTGTRLADGAGGRAAPARLRRELERDRPQVVEYNAQKKAFLVDIGGDTQALPPARPPDRPLRGAAAAAATLARWRRWRALPRNVAAADRN